MIVGIDEVGRGCWAGPLVAAAVLLNSPVRGLKDSKLLTRSQREKLSQDIRTNAEVGLGWVSSRQIDDLGLTAAINLAMHQALVAIKADYEEVIIDGNHNFLADMPKTRAVIKADLTISSVSAASIVAKVARDQFMSEQALKFPKYGFEKHVGYGTKFHIEMLKTHGVCELHRMSYKPIRALVS
ncbi:MAG TPA: ribonuclease HII [Patescibacteria group bacterium]|nr:ribonuclease HII [Patescibacteria group bacterium]